MTFTFFFLFFVYNNVTVFVAAVHACHNTSITGTKTCLNSCNKYCNIIIYKKKDFHKFYYKMSQAIFKIWIKVYEKIDLFVLLASNKSQFFHELKPYCSIEYR